MQDAENTSPGKQSLWRIPEFRFGILFLMWLLCTLLLLPIQQYPEFLKPLLPQTLHAGWEEFAVIKLEAILRLSSLICGFLALASLLTWDWKWSSRVGMFLLWLVLGMIWLSIMISTLGNVREGGARIRCSSNLIVIRQALRLYADNNAGFLPPNLETLEPQISQDHSDENIFRCPSKRPPGDEFSDYLYFGAGRKLEGAPFLLLQDRDKNHPGIYWNNLHSDGRLERGPKAH